MTGSEVERMPRTASRPMSGPPAGAFALMPLASQRVESRAKRHAGRTARWGPRVLAVDTVVRDRLTAATTAAPQARDMPGRPTVSPD
ncbi:MAG TPA: hypothetical protein VF657_06555 [Actinoplanes sp.]|jgi:hypothetical protein